MYPTCAVALELHGLDETAPFLLAFRRLLDDELEDAAIRVAHQAPAGERRGPKRW